MSNLLEDYLSEHAAAPELKQTVRTLRSWRARGEGPPWTRIGRLVFYSRAGIAHWLKGLEQKPPRARRAA